MVNMTVCGDKMTCIGMPNGTFIGQIYRRKLAGEGCISKQSTKQNNDGTRVRKNLSLIIWIIVLCVAAELAVQDVSTNIVCVINNANSKLFDIFKQTLSEESY